MSTRNTSIKRSESFTNSSSSDKIVPPWCSSRKLCERRKLVPKWEIQSSYPLRENIWEYLYKSNGENFKCASKRRNRKVCKQHEKNYRGRKTKLIPLIFLLLMLGFLGYLCKTKKLPNTNDWMNKLLSYTGNTFLTSGEWIYSSVSEECCPKMRYLALELCRTEQILRGECFYVCNSFTPKWFKGFGTKTYSNETIATFHDTTFLMETNRALDRQYIAGATATKGANTLEWGGRVALWGVVPLWRAAPPPTTVLALRNPTPADCWPFSGSSGELVIQLPFSQRVRSMSIEHIRPDSANSAPKHFIVYGILTNDSLIKLTENEYNRMGPPKQYYALDVKTPINNIIFKVLTNHGNLKYTCIYRVHLYGVTFDDKH